LASGLGGCFIMVCRYFQVKIALKSICGLKNPLDFSTTTIGLRPLGSLPQPNASRIF